MGALLGAAPIPQAPEPPAPGACAWVPLGPFAVPEGEAYDGRRVPVSGRVTSLALDSGDAATLYLGSALGGVWKSADRGESWEPLSDREASLAIGALVTDPKRPGTLWAGTGEANLAFREQLVVADRPLSGHAGKGVLKSVDGGRSWRLRGEDVLDGAAFAELAVSPHQPSLLLAATTRGLFRSLDAGETWGRLEAGLPSSGPLAMATSAVFHPSLPGVAFAAFWGKGVFRCEGMGEAGLSCRQLFGGLPLSNVSRIGLAASAAAPDTLFALIANADSFLRGLYISEDGGESWRSIPNAPDLLQGQGFFNLLLAAHPRQPGVLYLGGSGNRRDHPSSLYRAVRVNGEWRFIPLGSELHIDLHSLIIDPRDTDTLYAGTDGGAWRTRDAGRTWTACNYGLATLQFTRIDQHPSSPAYLLGGTQDNGTLIFRGGPVWDHGDDGDGGFVAIDRTRPEVVYNEFTLHKIARSEKAGEYGSFKPIYPEVKGSRSAFLAPFALDPGDPRTLALGLERVHLSKDSGETWTAITLDLSRGWTSARKVSAISSLLYPRSGLLYAGTTDGKVWRLSQAGGIWQSTDLTAAAGAPAADRYVADFAVAPDDPDLLLVAFAGGEGPSLWRCHFGADGAKWSPATGAGQGTLPAGPVFTIEADPRAPSRLYAGLSEGVWVSLDGGASWRAFDEGLPRTSAFDLQVHPSLPLLRVATHGRGVWERDISGRACPSVELFMRGGPDLKIVAASELSGEVGWVEFARMRETTPVKEAPHRLLVQIGNRGPRPSEARVRLFLAREGAAPPLPRGFPDETGNWRLLGETRVERVAQDLPRIAALSWTPPADLPQQVYLLAVIDAPGDPLEPPVSPEGAISFTNRNRQTVLIPVALSSSSAAARGGALRKPSPSQDRNRRR